MPAYIKSAVERFFDEQGGRPAKVVTPYVDDKIWAGHNDATGRFATSCASHVATVLFAARVFRLDASLATQRLCRNVSKWSVIDDLALVRLMSYLSTTSEYELQATLDPANIDSVYLSLFTDADWNGNPCTSRSTSGFLLEMTDPCAGTSWAISWGAKQQTFTASSTCEAESAALSTGLRQEGIPAQVLFELFLDRPVPMHVLVDNEQTIAAAKKGYSKKLRAFSRTFRCSLGVIHECIMDEALRISLGHVPSKLNKANLFTKALGGPDFEHERELAGIYSALR